MLRLTSLLLLLLLASGVQAQSLRTRTALPQWALGSLNPWSGLTRYKILTDYADDRSPRAYTQALSAGGKYQWNENWSISSELSARFETVGGQIEKDPEETRLETLNPSAALELDYDRPFTDTHSYTLFVHGEPLFDEPSRMEGYKAIAGLGGALSLGFFKRRYTFTQVLDISEVMNSFENDLAGDSNPDMFYTYKMVHTVRLYRALKAFYSFGIKLTRFLDASTKYSYNSTLSLSQSWGKFSLALTYDNGGFTDDGTVSMWYIDEFRRVFGLSMGYSF